MKLLFQIRFTHCAMVIYFILRQFQITRETQCISAYILYLFLEYFLKYILAIIHVAVINIDVWFGTVAIAASAYYVTQKPGSHVI